MAPRLSPRDQVLVKVGEANGIVQPRSVIVQAHRAGIDDIALAFAVLEQETGGGHNVFGHDPTIFAGAGAVTEAKYKAYLRARGSTGRGGMQGVGPMQLTWYSYQDKADELGGCWRPHANLYVGFSLLRDIIAAGGMRSVWKYNGALSYGVSVLAKRLVWKRRIRAALKKAGAR